MFWVGGNLPKKKKNVSLSVICEAKGKTGKLSGDTNWIKISLYWPTEYHIGLNYNLYQCLITVGYLNAKASGGFRSPLADISSPSDSPPLWRWARICCQTWTPASSLTTSWQAKTGVSYLIKRKQTYMFSYTKLAGRDDGRVDPPPQTCSLPQTRRGDRGRLMLCSCCFSSISCT